ncbi:hypothetical protein COBT_001942 [Conglomerata obtusa]
MEAHNILFGFYIARYFVPMTLFMTPYLIEKKKFTNKEVFNNITPFFFISSLVASFFGPVLVYYIGNQKTILFETGVELLTYVIFFYMPERSFSLAILTGLFHGMVTALGSLTKGILLENMPSHLKKDDMLARHVGIKKACGVFSSWIGQDMKFVTQSHQANLLFSFMTLFVSFGICTFIPSGEHRKPGGNLLILLASSDRYEKIRAIYTNECLIFSLLHIIGSTLYICFAMYSANIFIARKKDADPSVFKVGKVLYTMSKPIRFLSRFLVAFVGLFDRSIVYRSKYDKNTVIFGYIDGISRLAAMLSGIFISKKLLEDVNPYATGFISTVLIMFFTFAMGKANTLMKSYMIYILGSVFSQINILAVCCELNKDKDNIHTIYGMNLVASSIIHISVSYYCRWKRSEVDTKMLAYFYVSCAILLLAAGIAVANRL